MALALRQGPDQDDPRRPLPALGFRDSMTWPAVYVRGTSVDTKKRATSSTSYTHSESGRGPFGRWGPASQPGKGGAL